jgi:hypothetical protein
VLRRLSRPADDLLMVSGMGCSHTCWRSTSVTAQGFSAAQEYVDVETAKQTGRAAFGEMIGYLKEHPASRVILVEKSPAASGCVIMLLLVIATAFLMLAFKLDINIYDEGIIVAGAMRVAHGEIPHRDFYTIYGPANF